MSRFVFAVSAFLLLSVPAACQTAVEAGAAAAASSTGAAGARGTKKAIGGVFRNLNETLKSTPATDAAKTGPPAASRAKREEKAKPEDRHYEDALQIPKGIGYEELLRRFGPPAMQFASGNDGQTMSYITKGAVVQLELQGGKVISMVKPMEARPQEKQ